MERTIREYPILECLHGYWHEQRVRFRREILLHFNNAKENCRSIIATIPSSACTYGLWAVDMTGTGVREIPSFLLGRNPSDKKLFAKIQDGLEEHKNKP